MVINDPLIIINHHQSPSITISIPIFVNTHMVMGPNPGTQTLLPKMTHPHGIDADGSQRACSRFKPLANKVSTMERWPCRAAHMQAVLDNVAGRYGPGPHRSEGIMGDTTMGI